MQSPMLRDGQKKDGDFPSLSSQTGDKGNQTGSVMVELFKARS